MPALAKIPTLEVRIAVLALLIGAAALICTIAAQAMSESSDPQPLVLDEIVVLPIVFLGAPPLNGRLLLTGFLLFRLFDIWKPWPVGWADRELPGGLGVMADDMIAGLMAGVLVAALRYFLPL